MTIDLSSSLEKELRTLAGATGKNVDLLVEEAVRLYLDAASVTDVTPEEVAATQTVLIGELEGIPEWFDSDKAANDEAR